MLFADPREQNGNIIIENNCLIGSGVHIYVSNHRFDLNDQDIVYQGHYEPYDVILKEGCWIGAGAIILPNVTIGKNAVVGAGSVVTKSIPDRVVAVGNPAKIIKNLN
jgi:acetyltransferase-like isoleucine patch superfamily enzyme